MSSTDAIRVMVVDDHPIMRKGLREVLEDSGRVEVVGQAGDGEEAVRAARELKPDVVVMDVIMPRMDGIDACREIMDALPGTPVMMLSASTELERDTLRLFAGGMSYPRIAEERGKKTVTVRNTLYRIQNKLGIESKQELVIWAVRNGLMDDVVVGEEP